MPHADDSLVEYAPLVRKLALQLLARLPASVELDDLIQAGMIGLLDAVRRYQETADAQFETYATTRIRGAMLDELRGQDWLPRSVRTKARKIEQAIQQLEQRLMRAPSEAEIAAQLEMPIEEYQSLLHDAQGVQIVHYEDFT
ncbi:MAG: sigma-70 family RNA polymerase sigma factor, partial [Alcaligenes sp.]